MHMFFLDESGSPPKTADKANFFVLGGVIIPDDAWCGVRQALNALKQKYRVTGEIKWRYFSPKNDDSTNPMLHLTLEERATLRTDIFGLIASNPKIKLICIITSVKAAFDLPSIKDDIDLYEFTYKPASERFQYYLQDLSKVTHKKELGIIICDQRNNLYDKRLVNMHQKLLTVDQADRYSYYPNLVEGLFMAPSHFSVGIQLADLVAGAVYRYYEKNDKTFVSLIKSSFRTSPDGKKVVGYGIIKHPKTSWR